MPQHFLKTFRFHIKIYNIYNQRNTINESKNIYLFDSFIANPIPNMVSVAVNTKTERFL